MKSPSIPAAKASRVIVSTNVRGATKPDKGAAQITTTNRTVRGQRPKFEGAYRGGTPKTTGFM